MLRPLGNIQVQGPTRDVIMWPARSVCITGPRNRNLKYGLPSSSVFQHPLPLDRHCCVSAHPTLSKCPPANAPPTRPTPLTRLRRPRVDPRPPRRAKSPHPRANPHRKPNPRPRARQLPKEERRRARRCILSAVARPELPVVLMTNGSAL
jgi:hypothetical protein